jgi:menaquinone-9 beta-reductase
MIEWDIAVIGGGIAGSTAAGLLAQHGLRVILLEKGDYPRQKVCGEFLSPEGVDVLQRLGVWPQLNRHTPPRIHSLTLTAETRETRQRLPLPGWGVSRWVLDHALWEHVGRLGVATRERCVAQQIEGDPGRGFSLTVRQAGLPLAPVKARVVLCATGRQWQARAQRRTPDKGVEPRFVGIKAHFRGVPLEGHVELHTFRHGYCGLVEVTGDVSNLCCWVEAAAFRRAGGTPPRALVCALTQNLPLRVRLQMAEQVGTHWITTSCAHRRTATPVTEDIWNIGDRAAMVAPFTGDGMGMGLRAAELAATILPMAFRRELSWDQASTEYARRWRQEFRPCLRWGRRLEGILLQPRLASLACLALNWMPSLMELFYHRTRHMRPTTDAPVRVS